MAQFIETAIKSKIVSRVALATAIVAGIIIIGTAAAGLISQNQRKGDGKGGYGYGSYPPPQPPPPPSYGYNRTYNTWNGCRGTGFNVCTDALHKAFGQRATQQQIQQYFRGRPYCIPNATCAGKFFQCESVCDHPLGINTSYRTSINFLNISAPTQPSGTLGARTFNALRFDLSNSSTNRNAQLSNLTVDVSLVRNRPTWFIRSAKLYNGTSQVCNNGIISVTNTIKFNNCSRSSLSLIRAGSTTSFEIKLTISGTASTNDALQLFIKDFGSQTTAGNLWWKITSSPAIDIKWVNSSTPILQGGFFIQ